MPEPCRMRPRGTSSAGEQRARDRGWGEGPSGRREVTRASPVLLPDPRLRSHRARIRASCSQGLLPAAGTGCIRRHTTHGEVTVAPRSTPNKKRQHNLRSARTWVRASARIWLLGSGRLWALGYGVEGMG